MRYDLHLHTCLSPCADDDMTPATVAGLAKLAGAELIAVTEHNSALNLPAAEAACRAYGLRLLPGIEVNTAEEMHLLCYFKTVERALEYGEALYEALPAFPYAPAVWGEQLVMDEEDRVERRVERLLPGAALWDVDQANASGRGYTKGSFAVMRAMGLSDRSPAEVESEFIEKWFWEYGFTRELIVEAVSLPRIISCGSLR